MEYGLLGEHLTHSFSKEIHGLIADYKYELKEVKREDLNTFITERSFRGLNVTIPYKEKVMPLLDRIDESALAIGSVNTIVNNKGQLSGYNTDYLGMAALFKHAGIDPAGKRAVIFGTGGTSKTAQYTLKKLGCKEFVVVSRKKVDSFITYDELDNYQDYELIVNTTPCGMYPDVDSIAYDISGFKQLEGVIDVVYNPLRTKLIRAALKRGIRAEGGLFMLVAQAFYATELFMGTKLDESLLEEIYQKILSDKQNIVLIGMPTCGKSTIGALLAQKLSKEFFDADIYLEAKYEKKITDIFKEKGESYFRDLECSVIKELSLTNGAVIATGGGAVLRHENIDYLKSNGRLYFIDRDLDLLVASSDRPLSSDIESLKKRYYERIDLYLKSADLRVMNNGSLSEALDLIEKEHQKWKS